MTDIVDRITKCIDDVEWPEGDTGVIVDAKSEIERLREVNKALRRALKNALEHINDYFGLTDADADEMIEAAILDPDGFSLFRDR